MNARNHQMSCRPLEARDAVALGDLFALIADDPSAARFHPHPFTFDAARKVAAHRGQDCYLGLFGSDGLVGYGMLRGWDDGYEVPSLGIYVAPQARGSGASALLMRALHDEARARSAPRVRLKVYPDNISAVSLYEKLGYRFDGVDGEQRVGYFELRTDQGSSIAHGIQAKGEEE